MKTVLVVDPDPTARKNLLETLPLNQVNVTELANGMQVLRFLKEHSVDLVISEVNLPEVGGLDLAKAIKKHPDHSRTNIIFVTDKNDPMSMIEGVKAGAKQYFTKPFKVVELREKLGRILSTS